MKTSIFLTVCLAISFFACDQETDYLTPGDLQFSQTNSENVDVLDDNGATSQRNQCIELTTAHWLTGTGRLQPIREKAPQETNMDNISSRRYSIEASGDAMSELYARGFSALSLIYDARTYRLTGAMTTRFYYGEILELKLESDAQVRYEGNTMKITSKVTEATFKTGKGELEIENGEISFIFPLMPEGQFVININTKTTLCEL